MNQLKIASVTLAVAASLALSLSARAEDMVRYRAKPIGSMVRIDGVANVHDWTMEGSLIGGYLEVPANVVLDSSQADVGGVTDGKLKATADVSIRISSIKNIHGYEGMDDVMQDAMNASTSPWIKYHVTEMTLKTPHAPGTPFQFDTKGELSFNNVTNKVSMPVSITSLDKTKLKISAAAVPVSMADFNVKPPVKLGVFKTDPGVKISFDWVVGLSAKAGEAK
ncbi:MAG TPA: YceI family protein [Verrucomicrobiae bacterium]|jgi:hypothetical protein|nr:YceI family protein [Verrucomicrobiae bacterium]